MYANFYNGVVAPSELGNISQFFDSKSINRPYNGNTNIYVRFVTKSTKVSFANLTSSSAQVLVIVKSVFNSIQIETDAPFKNSTSVMESNSWYGKNLTSLSKAEVGEAQTIPLVANIKPQAERQGKSVDVPSNYRVDFNITPMAVVAYWSNVFIYSQYIKPVHLMSTPGTF